MPKLYELSTAYNAILQQLEDADETQLEMLTDSLECVQASIEVKVDGISKMLKIISDSLQESMQGHNHLLPVDCSEWKLETSLSLTFQSPLVPSATASSF